MEPVTLFLLIASTTSGDITRELELFLDQPACKKMLGEEVSLWGDDWTLTCKVIRPSYLTHADVRAIFKRTHRVD